MSEPLKPRIDFSGPLDVEQNTAFKAQQMFNETEAQTFSPATVDEPLEDEGQAEAVIDAALRPKRSLWRKMVMGGLALFGVSVVAQGVQWTMNAWQTQDWVALGGQSRRRIDYRRRCWIGGDRMASAMAIASARARAR